MASCCALVLVDKRLYSVQTSAKRKPYFPPLSFPPLSFPLFICAFPPLLFFLFTAYFKSKTFVPSCQKIAMSSGVHLPYTSGLTGISGLVLALDKQHKNKKRRVPSANTSPHDIQLHPSIAHQHGRRGPSPLSPSPLIFTKYVLILTGTKQLNVPLVSDIYCLTAELRLPVKSCLN